MPLARTRSETFDAIEIRGGSEFLLRTQEALALLRPTSRFADVRSNLGLIRQGRRSGMRAWAQAPTFVVGKRTWKHSALWYAGAIAHDAYHAKLYADAKRATQVKSRRRTSGRELKQRRSVSLFSGRFSWS